MKREKWSKCNERMKGILFDGKAVKRQVGMIYWYSWGSWEFDIRVVRDVLGLPLEHPDDHWYSSKPLDPAGSFERLMSQIQDALTQQGKRLFDVIKVHDEIIMKRGQSL